MKVSVLSKMYNEVLIAPFFLDHYSFADEIIVNLDVDSNDGTIELLEKSPQVKIHWSTCIGGQNERIFTEEENKLASECKSDWLFYVDADEFLFPPNNLSINQALELANGNVIYASMWQVYKHETDKELDYNEPALFQRRHGDPNRTDGYNAHYNKPTIIKPEINIKWHEGHQYYFENEKIKVTDNIVFDGAHWRLPDIKMTIERRILGRKNRFSEESLVNGWGGQHFDITVEKILAEYEEHKNDPILF